MAEAPRTIKVTLDVHVNVRRPQEDSEALLRLLRRLASDPKGPYGGHARA